MSCLAYIWEESLHSMIRSSLLIASFYAALGKRKQTKNILDDVMPRCLINPDSQLVDNINYDIVKHADGDALWRLISSIN